ILLHVVDLSVYPEGGDLVASIPTRVYFEARTPADKPADVAGTIESGDGHVVATFRTEHEGRGRVRLTPEAGQHYLLRITEPAGVDKTYALPEVTTTGGVISSFDDVAKAGAPLRVRVAGAGRGSFTVTVAQHEK